MNELLEISLHKELPKQPSHRIIFCDNQENLLAYSAVDDHTKECATKLLKASGFNGAIGEFISNYGAGIVTPLSLIGVGDLDDFADNIDKITASIYKASKNSPAASIYFPAEQYKYVQQFVTALLNSAYRFERYKSKPSSDKLKHVVLIIDTADFEQELKDGLNLAYAIAKAQFLARDVANEPGNICTPKFMASQAKKLGKNYSEKINVRILGEKKMQALGMGAFLAVSQGSDNEGKLAVIEYFGKSSKEGGQLDNPIALVGKGVTFDTGGISLKPASGMDEMKFDMGGAAAMLGTALGLCEANLPIDVVIVLALAENMPSGHASRPGDIVTAMDGTSIEILNTDAEGRLVLADALCYVQDNYKPCTIIDAATLTGACVVALGHERSGLYSNNRQLLKRFEHASEYSGDLVWFMPLGENYARQLKSPVADLQNIGNGKGGGSITAACFLQHFIKNNTPWVHLDIAGTAWIGGENKGSTGRPVPLLMQYLYDINNDNA